ncbi:reverse transcriptase domain-containing protein [Engelhardtia mirabilis]|uniref:Reverse transcriptase (RNA-dependent DNA polymerase) n=1 Tax=Engelhardtia mirabilis TaxID=2528011 RepID=A0A518BL03_9BACT|nr:Reverse transcriptase (RNA-dependent DNA polymerase) [Planctomycetes bacterium Pla133]QDV01972.1 Reverse transcriptase (RNA-dependent DNA polymerase) [Planctomycetes bacterium Pla86]
MTRTTGGLFEQLVDEDRLDEAARVTVRGKRRRADVATFLFRRESELRELRAALVDARWRHGAFDLLFLHDPKPRVIARASVLDRVVHTAVARLVEAVLERSLSDADYACRTGRGTHRALLRILELVRRHAWFVHLDVRSYFPSIRIELVRSLLRRRIRDERFLQVVDRILESGRGLYDDRHVRAFARLDPDWPPPGEGLPIGAYTSQVLAAHVVPLGLDSHVARELRVPGYVRYVDDLFLFGDSRSALRAARDDVGRYLDERLGLRLKRPGARPRSCSGRLDALGHLVTRSGIEPLPRHARRMGARAARYVRGTGPAIPAEGWAGALGSVLCV